MKSKTKYLLKQCSRLKQWFCYTKKALWLESEDLFDNGIWSVSRSLFKSNNLKYVCFEDVQTINEKRQQKDS